MLIAAGCGIVTADAQRQLWHSKPHRGIALRFMAGEYTRCCEPAGWLSFDAKWREDGLVIQPMAAHLAQQCCDDRNVGGHPTQLSAVV